MKFTDGCSSQYKSCKAFEDISNSETYLGINVIRPFDLDMGKGPVMVKPLYNHLKTPSPEIMLLEEQKN